MLDVELPLELGEELETLDDGLPLKVLVVVALVVSVVLGSP